MICYTPNFEDVILQRALRGIANGLYVDVGACNPITDSNTIALYRQGWRGLCLDPIGDAEKWAYFRPKDTFVRCAAGSAAGTLEFFVNKKFGQCSSGSRAFVDTWEANGWPAERLSVPVLPLNELIAGHVGRAEIHLLSVDVEGMEREVLAGFDFGVYRPWVIVIEAALPGTDIPSHEPWENLVLAAGYTMVYFDGVNRFYLANERTKLRERFARPPNGDDCIVLAREMLLRKKVAALEQRLNELMGAPPSEAQRAPV